MWKLRQEKLREFLLFPVLYILLRRVRNWAQHHAKQQRSPCSGAQRLSGQGL